MDSGPISEVAVSIGLNEPTSPIDLGTLAAAKMNRAGKIRGSTALISVVINNYNFGRFLADAIDSADATGAEVVIVDDGSTDNSSDILIRYGERVTAVRQENHGQAAALNSGIAASPGDVVLQLDADDVVAPQRIDRVAHSFRTSEVQWLRHDMFYVGDSSGSRG